MVNYAIVGGALVVYLIVAFVVTLPDPPIGRLIAGAIAIVLGVAMFFFPFAKTIWSAIDLVMHGWRSDESPRCDD